MNNNTLNGFRSIAAMMNTEATDWQWNGVHMSQQMFGITEKRAKEYAEKFGGKASKMVPVSEIVTYTWTSEDGRDVRKYLSKETAERYLKFGGKIEAVKG